MSKKISIFSSAYSAAGDYRERNEDFYFSGKRLDLWGVADGIGSLKYGDLASRVTLEEVQKSYNSSANVEAAIIKAQHFLRSSEFYSEYRIDPKEAMGTTVALLELKKSTFSVFWLGDSRVYLWRDGRLSLLTFDHTYKQKYIDADICSEKIIDALPNSQNIYKWVGNKGLVEKIDVAAGDFMLGDIFCLCTDGISGFLSDSDISNYIAQSQDDGPNAMGLVELALEQGSTDNLTAIFVRLS